MLSANQSNACRAASKRLDPVEDQRDRGLHAPIRILLEAVAGLRQSRPGPPRRVRRDGPSRSERQASAGAEDQVSYFVETSLEPQQQSVVAVPGRVDRLLIDKNRYRTTRQILRSAVANPGRCGRNARPSRAQTAPTLPRQTLGHHPFETGALHAAGRRAAEIVVDSLRSRRNPAPSADRAWRIATPRPQQALCNTWWGRGLAHVEDRLALL